MKRKYHLQDASKKTPAKTFFHTKVSSVLIIDLGMRLARAMVFARAAAIPNNASFLACSFGSGYIWTGEGGSTACPMCHERRDENSLIILIELGIVMTAKSPEMARNTKKAY